jgi:hypothetical protein
MNRPILPRGSHVQLQVNFYSFQFPSLIFDPLKIGTEIIFVPTVLIEPALYYMGLMVEFGTKNCLNLILGSGEGYTPDQPVFCTTISKFGHKLSNTTTN